MKYLESEFGSLDNRYIKFLLFYSIICGVLSAIPQFNLILCLIVIVSILFSIFKNPIFIFNMYTISAIYIENIFPSAFIILFQVLMIIVFILFNKKMIYKFKKSSILMMGLIIIIMSCLFGYKSNFNTAIQMVVCLFLVIVLINSNSTFTDENISKCIFGYFCSAISLICYFGIQLVTGTLVFKYGRLSFLGDIKSVSTIIAVPLILLISSKLENKKLFKNMYFKKIDIVLIILLLLILVLT